MTRYKAAGLHLAISITVACLVGALLYFIWFPPPYFIAAGASTLMLVLMGVDVCIGPLLTLVVFNPAKRKTLLQMDLSIIAILQAAAFGYGLYVICQARPVFIVGEVDRFVVVAADQLDAKDLVKGSTPAFRRRSWTGPLLVGALPPRGPQAPAIAMRAMAGGKDIDRLPAFYVPYDRVAAGLLKRAKPLSVLKPTTATQRRQLQDLKARADAHGQSLLFLPLERENKDYTAIVTTAGKRPIVVLSIDPWISETNRTKP